MAITRRCHSSMSESSHATDLPPGSLIDLGKTSVHQVVNAGRGRPVISMTGFLRRKRMAGMVASWGLGIQLEWSARSKPHKMGLMNRETGKRGYKNLAGLTV